MYGNLAHDKLIDRGDWHEKLNLNTHRYMSEDIGMGLCLLTTLGEALGLDMPIAAGLLALGSEAAGTDFRSDGRTWQSCGLAELDTEALRDFLIKGEGAKL